MAESHFMVKYGLIFVMAMGLLACNAGVFFMNKDYGSRIEKECLLVDMDNAPSFLSAVHWKQSTNSQLRNGKENKTYALLLRLKNKDQLRAWGEINIKIKQFRNKIHVVIPDLGANSTVWSYYLVSLGGVILSDNEDSPKIEMEWGKLYTK
jgi:hypothetical protein